MCNRNECDYCKRHLSSACGGAGSVWALTLGGSLVRLCSGCATTQIPGAYRRYTGPVNTTEHVGELLDQYREESERMRVRIQELESELARLRAGGK